MKRFSVALLAMLPLFLISCQSARVQSGKAIYCPGVQLEKVSSQGEMISDFDWQNVSGEKTYVSITNLQNGKRTRTQILMRKMTGTGSVVVSINKNAAEALGMAQTGMAPVEIRYIKRTL
ncbi:hypothetical protein SAMN05421788_1011068 [Filimonas lacunae]|uniref:Lipoprotein n=1 Tax=Filimonas lacunae TaxID=477680 RepID=A0A173MPR3_9BACT|nr:hypothetical protein [Filimonas lacunae]BAV09634.1 hypothetical protein FLA_5685 [Filimonas lacunae]SIS76259.1 hypothetical protein SAMN05421788_1011068 [Filimonas lacunae]